MQQPGFSEVDPHPLSCLTWGQLSRIQIQIQIQKDTNTDEDTKPNKSVIQIPGSPDVSAYTEILSTFYLAAPGVSFENYKNKYKYIFIKNTNANVKDN